MVRRVSRGYKRLPMQWKPLIRPMNPNADSRSWRARCSLHSMDKICVVLFAANGELKRHGTRAAEAVEPLDSMLKLSPLERWTEKEQTQAEVESTSYFKF